MTMIYGSSSSPMHCGRGCCHIGELLPNWVDQWHNIHAVRFMGGHKGMTTSWLNTIYSYL